ncbi:MAG TPA: UDP-N-acetylmuramate--L-alanine ligase [Candidatus Moranbacteria bacterium]|nr:UDP-N-acetylmuramate--L-alanine ligase [Candidatus Moranbacteria bacterium]HAT74575.1 UDP-N-acetylmuramate--L-alanine ligase [Candidatus Moranbacteria bacterium]
MIDLKKIRKIYIIGIKGSGVVAIAEILKSMGVEISGSDVSEKFFTDEVLQKLGINYFEEFSAKNIPADADLILYSTAYNAENNIEFKTAREKNIPMISYPEILAELFNQKYGIAVCGTHGKTTTSAMLAFVLQKVGVSPTAVIGSRVRQWGTNAIVGKSEHFIIEADEFQNKLKLYEPKAVILTSIDYDHPDFFKTFEDYKKAFENFVTKIPKIGFLVVWGESVSTLAISKNAKCNVLSYGFLKDCDYKISNYQFPIFNDQIFNSSFQSFDVSYRNKNLGNFKIQLIGKHNALNAAAVIATCYKLNFNMTKVRSALAEFEGTSRRFEYIGEKNGAILIDDYAHHPEEIKATLKVAREIYPEKNIIAVFHPHSYSRTEALLQDFAQSFDDSDQVIVLDIYGSARENTGKVSSLDLVKLINKYSPAKADYIPTINETVEFLQDKIGANDVVIAIGAGNVWEVARKLKDEL